MATFVEGGRITFGGREFIVPKATLRTCIALEDVQKVVASGEVGAMVGMAGIMLLLLQPAQPDLTLEQLLDLPIESPEELGQAMRSVQLMAGFKQVPEGEAGSP